MVIGTYSNYVCLDDLKSTPELNKYNFDKKEIPALEKILNELSFKRNSGFTRVGISGYLVIYQSLSTGLELVHSNYPQVSGDKPPKEYEVNSFVVSGENESNVKMIMSHLLDFYKERKNYEFGNTEFSKTP